MPEIKPALTPDEWHAALKDRAGMAAALQRAWEPENDHQLAALALVLQPFGFTQEEAAVAREMANDYAYIVGSVFHPEKAVAARSLAAKVCALLPPVPPER